MNDDSRLKMRFLHETCLILKIKIVKKLLSEYIDWRDYFGNINFCEWNRTGVYKK